MQDAAVMLTPEGFSLQGNVTLHNVLVLRKQGEKLLKQCLTNNKSVTINLSHFKDHHASSFSLLLCWLRLAKQNHCHIAFVNLPLSMQRMSKLFGLSILVGILNG